MVKEYNHIEHVVPASAIVESVRNEDKRFLERLAPALEEEMPLGSTVMYLAGPYYGCLATIEGIL